MLPVGWLVVAVVVAVLFAVVATLWFSFTMTRLDRLHARVDARLAALDAQLVRRAAALQHVAETPDSRLPVHDRTRLDVVARTALVAEDADERSGDTTREHAENVVGRAVRELVERRDTAADDAVAELREAAARVLVARRFYNDAVRDTRLLRERRLLRLLHMAGHREMPRFFDIDDTVPAPYPPPPVASAAPSEVPSTESPAAKDPR